MAFKQTKLLKLDPSATVTPKVVNDLQFNLNQAISQVLGKDSLDVTLLQNQVLVPGLNKVAHTLGRNIQGWYPVRPRQGYALLWEDAINNPTTNLLVYIYSAVNCTVDLIVF